MRLLRLVSVWLVCVIGGLVLVLLSTSEKPESFPRLDLGGVDAAVVDEGLAVRLTVTNTTRLRLTGGVWWTLHQPDSEDPWLDRLYRSQSRRVDLQRGASEVVEWEELPSVTPGRYQVAVWAHVDSGSGSEHSDVETAGPVELSQSVDLLRVQAPPVGAAIATVQSTPRGSSLHLEVRLHRRGPATDMRLTAETIVWPSDEPWWRAPSTASQSVFEVTDDVTRLELPMMKGGPQAVRVRLDDRSGQRDLVLLEPAS